LPERELKRFAVSELDPRLRGDDTIKAHGPAFARFLICSRLPCSFDLLAGSARWVCSLDLLA
jgi:hypothetical protein